MSDSCALCAEVGEVHSFRRGNQWQDDFLLRSLGGTRRPYGVSAGTVPRLAFA